MDTLLASPRLRMALFVLVALMLGGLTVWLMTSGNEDTPLVGPTKGAQAPTAAPTTSPTTVEPSASASPTATPSGKPKPVPVTEARIKDYLTVYLTFTWLDDRAALEDAVVAAGGAPGTLGESPWAGPGQWVACQQVQCSSELISFDTTTITKDTIEANVVLRRSANGIPDTGPAVCHVSVDEAGAFTGVACVGGDG